MALVADVDNGNSDSANTNNAQIKRWVRLYPTRKKVSKVSEMKCIIMIFFRECIIMNGYVPLWEVNYALILS